MRSILDKVLRSTQSRTDTTADADTFTLSQRTTSPDTSPKDAFTSSNEASSSTRPSLAERIQRNSRPIKRGQDLGVCDTAGDNMVGRKVGPRVGFRPVNTLGNSTLSGKRPIIQHRPPGEPQAPSTTLTLETHKSKGSNVHNFKESHKFAADGAKRRRLDESSVDLTGDDLEHGTLVAVNGKPVREISSAGLRERGYNGDSDPFQSVQRNMARPTHKNRRKSKDQTLSSTTDNYSTAEPGRSPTPEFMHYQLQTKANGRTPKQSSTAKPDSNETDSDDILHGGNTPIAPVRQRPDPLHRLWGICELHTNRYRLGSELALDLSFDDFSSRFKIMQSGKKFTPQAATQHLEFGGAELREITHNLQSSRVICRGASSTRLGSERFLLIEFATPDSVKQFIDTAAACFRDIKLLHPTLEDVNERYANARKGMDRARVEREIPIARTVRHQSKATPRLSVEEPTTRRSKRTSAVNSAGKQSPVAEKWTAVNMEMISKKFRNTVVFPLVGENRVSVDPQDLERLDEGEFLNDNVINFALRQIYEDMNPEKRPRIHMFNTHFYTAMTANTSRYKINYDAVKRWTRRKDIFNVPFIIVPINLNLHWYAAIICNLNTLVGRKTVQDVPSIEPSITIPPEKAPSEDRIVYEDDAATAERPKEVAPKKPKNVSQRKYDVREPIIITLDSLGNNHPAEIRNLKEYVVAEAMDKRSVEIETQDLKGLTAKGIPEQSNFCDCGLYLIAYIQQLAKDPAGFVKRILERDEPGLSHDFAAFNPSAERKRLRDDLFKLSEQQLVERLAKKRIKKPASPVVKPPDLSTTPQTAAQSSPTKALNQESETNAPESEENVHLGGSNQDVSLGDTVPDSQEEEAVHQ